MPLLNDVTIAKRVVGNLWRSRVSRQRLSRRIATNETPKPGSITIAVYFADSEVNMYQIRQWYAPLAELSKRWPVAIISRSPGAAVLLMDESPVPVLYLRQVVDLEEFVAAQQVHVVLYVNQNPRNFQMMRYARMWHVFINHGESDKVYMVTNQFKAYDYSLVAGQAALDRLGRKLWDFDLDRRAITIGRPQADHFAGDLPYLPDGRTVVLYAPTWEGDRASASYGSVATHGVALVTALLADQRYRVIYRPHPRSGVVDAAYGRANTAIIRAIAAANAADATAQHVFDDGPGMGWQLVAADVAITDISAMVYDRLATGKPIIVTRPVSPEAEIDSDGFLGSAVWLTADAASDVIATVDRAATDSAILADLEHWVHYYFGDTAPGEATRRFHAAIERLDAEWHRHAALHAADDTPPPAPAA
ncbi:CDP-glycerol glycerophosphotransferase family protein [Marisediminicola senii]|uniref:CDP-glycerol glycerophosphotransferase family protein n=1 Tax=Marisediminicola senii TaxID=2711233 RepID=UPI0013E9C099|nr:CDP-glycerol glycerophosphotransferase family protein [Marisediminicola senii]